MSLDWLVIRTFWCVFDAKNRPGNSLAGRACFQKRATRPERPTAVNRAFLVKCVFFALARRSEFLVNIAERLWGLSHETNFSHRLLHGHGFGPDG
jgi:hypothetical protein